MKFRLTNKPNRTLNVWRLYIVETVHVYYGRSYYMAVTDSIDAIKKSFADREVLAITEQLPNYRYVFRSSIWSAETILQKGILSCGRGSRRVEIFAYKSYDYWREIS